MANRETSVAHDARVFTNPDAAVRAAVYLLILVAGALRLWDIGGKSFWVDEARGLLINNDTFGNVGRRCALTHTAPLREYLLYLTALAPRGMLEALSRLPSALAGILSVPALFLLGRRLFGWQVGLCAAAILAIHPWHLFYSQDNRMHTVPTFFCIAMLGLFFDLCQTERARARWGLLGLVGGFALWFNYLSILFLVPLGGLFCVEWVRRVRAKAGTAGAFAAGGGIACAVMLCSLTPLYGAFGNMVDLYLSFPEGEAAGGVVGASVSPYLTRYDWDYLRQLFLKLGGDDPAAARASALFACVGLLVLWRTGRRFLWCPLLFVLAPLPFLLLTNARFFFPTRYLLHFLVIYSLLAGVGLTAVVGWVLRAWCVLASADGNLRMLNATAAGILFLGGVWVGLLLSGAWSGVDRYYQVEKQDWRQAVRYIEEQARPGDRILVGDHWADSGVWIYRDFQSPKRLRYLTGVLSFPDFEKEAGAGADVWYVHWAVLPDYIQRVVSESMVEVRRFPGVLGDVRVWRGKAWSGAGGVSPVQSAASVRLVSVAQRAASVPSSR